MNRLEAIKRRRVMEEFVTPQIPGVFLEWIESTDTQYIDTLKPWNTSYEFNIDFKLGTTPDIGGLFGTLKTGTRIVAYMSDGKTFRGIGYFGLTDKSADSLVGSPEDYVFGTRYQMRLFQNTLSLGNKKYTNVAYTPNLTPTTSLWVFKRNSDPDTPGSRLEDITVWNFNIKNEVGTDLLNLRPFLHDDGRVGMWDTIGHKFYPNMGEGEFIAGPVVDDDFWELEYIESNGNQWLDTELKGEYNSVVEITFSNTSQSYANIMGARKAAYEEDLTLIMENGSLLSDFGGMEQNRLKYAISTDKYNVILNQNGSHYINGVKVFDIPRPPLEGFITHHSLLLFDVYGNYQQIPYAGKVYYYKHSLGDNLIQHLIPVQKKISGEVCMYDLVSKKFFSNQGTGEFIAGPIKND